MTYLRTVPIYSLPKNPSRISSFVIRYKPAIGVAENKLRYMNIKKMN